MKITVGAILFNSASILPSGLFEKWLEHIYDIGDQIILVEGATSLYSEGSSKWATKNGSSTDNTVAIIEAFPDPRNKIKLIKADGFWDSKTEMCNQWAKHVTGDYIWQIDSDEFYLKQDVRLVRMILNVYKPDAIHFYANHFWGDFDHCIDDKEGKWANEHPWKRIFKHEQGARWLSHEPPSYANKDGIPYEKDVIDRDMMNYVGARMFHYSCVSKSQVDFKSKFFRNDSYSTLWDKWQEDNSIPLINGTKTKRYDGEHPINIGELVTKNV